MADKIKIKENTSWNGLDSPRFSIALEDKRTEAQQRQINYDALSKLIGGSGVLIEMDDSLLSMPNNKREAYALKFLEDIRSLGVEYKCQSIAPSTKPSFLSRFFGNKSSKAQQILAYVPNGTWSMPEMKDILPLYGARYFVPKENTDGPEVLEEFQKILDMEKLSYFKLAAFNVIIFNSIGVYTRELSLADVRAVFGL